MSETTPSKPKIIASAIGRRKRAVASVRLISGKGEIEVNGMSAADYFPGLQAQMKYEAPLKILELDKKYAATVKAHGGGNPGQLDATIMGLARALSSLKPEYQVLMQHAHLLTRDSRERQRRKVGMGGKSRRKKQSPKR
jgi:small subunit ribosomal protein S9